MYKKKETKKPTTKITKINGDWMIEKDGQKTYWSGKFPLEEVKKLEVKKKQQAVNPW